MSAGAAEATWSELVGDPRLGERRAILLQLADTGKTLFELRSRTPACTASVLKTLTSAAALTVLGSERRLATRVVRGAHPEEVVVVGGGDVTLCGLPTGADALYHGAAHVDELARRVVAARADRGHQAREPIRRLVVDDTLFGGPGWLPSWGDSAYERENDGATPIMSALMIDADRSDPLDIWAPRGDDPSGTAGDALARALEVAGRVPSGSIEVVSGTAPAGAAELARVESVPLYELVRQGLIDSDNAIMESLARHVAITRGFGDTAAAGGAAVADTVAGFGIDVEGVHVADGSGLSDENAVPPATVAALVRLARAREHGLGMLYDLLPVSGYTMASDRFTGDSAVVGQNVHAKSGWINETRTLAGTVRARDGIDLVFAVFALGDIDSSAKEAIDAVVAGAYRRGADPAAYRD